jgi:hypothetical protein
MLEKLMAKIATLEQAVSPPEGINISPDHWVPHYSSFDSKRPGSPGSTHESSHTHENNQYLHLGQPASPSEPMQLREEMTKQQGKYLPCHYFDYIGGTSTGG